MLPARLYLSRGRLQGAAHKVADHAQNAGWRYPAKTGRAEGQVRGDRQGQAVLFQNVEAAGEKGSSRGEPENVVIGDMFVEKRKHNDHKSARVEKGKDGRCKGNDVVQAEVGDNHAEKTSAENYGFVAQPSLAEL